MLTSGAVKTTSKTFVVLNWRQPLDDGGCSISGYTIKKDDGNNGAFTDVDSTVGLSTFTYNITSGLTSGKTYRFEIIAKNQVGETIGKVINAITADVPQTPTTGH